MVVYVDMPQLCAELRIRALHDPYCLSIVTLDLDLMIEIHIYLFVESIPP